MNRQIRGHVRLWHRGEGSRIWRLVHDAPNLWVNAGNTALASLLAGASPLEDVVAIGFGSGNTQPAVTDTALSASPAYYKKIDSYSLPQAGSVAFAFSLSPAADPGAPNPLAIQEVGLFANAPTVEPLPAQTGGAYSSWIASHAYASGAVVIDSNGNIQECTTAGTSGASAPAWATAMAATTADGSAVWTLVAAKTAPSPLMAHQVWPLFSYTGQGSFTGTWTITF